MHHSWENTVDDRPDVYHSTLVSRVIKQKRGRPDATVALEEGEMLVVNPVGNSVGSYALYDKGALKEGETLVVLGASGGVVPPL